MKLNRLFAAALAVASTTCQPSFVPAQTTSGSVKWVTFNDCPVLLESRYVVPAKESGTVESVAIDRNESVTKGQLLLSLEKDEAEMELETAQANQAVALHLAADDSDLKLKKLALKQAQEELASYSEIAESVSSSELRRLRLAEVGAGVAVTNAENALERLGMQAKIAAHVVKSKSVKLANRKVLAPSDGIVDKVLVRPGEWVDVGKPVLEIADLRQLQVDCLIPIEKTDLKKLVGLEVLVESNHRDASGTPVRLRGKISSYDPKLSPHGEVRVHCRIQNQQTQGHWQLLPEMNVRLEVGVPTPTGMEKPPLISRRPK